nr:tetratricopeptide repeat protein [Verrucomicrobiota bacterium]
MKKVPLVSSLLLLLGCLALPAGGEAAIIYRSNEGWTIEGEGNKVERSAAEQMRKAETLEAEGNTKAAYAAYRVLVKEYGLSALAPKAQRKVGMLLERNGEFDKAFEAFNTYLTKYPRGDDFDSVVESMFKIGKMFLEGSQKKKVLGVPLGGSVERARTMFETIVKRAPFSRWAPLAQFNIGQTYEKQGQFPEAILAYQTCVARYPTDPVADDAQYQIGYVRLVDFRKGSYDQASAQKAREAFEDFINRYPDSEKVPQ